MMGLPAPAPSCACASHKRLCRGLYMESPLPRAARALCPAVQNEKRRKSTLFGSTRAYFYTEEGARATRVTYMALGKPG